ncbi:agmatinase, mitochondrial, partial [Pseudomonas aeruginosa]
MIRPYNMATGAAPFDSLNVADIGDVAINTFNLLEAVRIIEQEYDRILGHGILPLTLGATTPSPCRSSARSRRSTARSAWSTSTPTPTSTTTC